MSGSTSPFEGRSAYPPKAAEPRGAATWLIGEEDTQGRPDRTMAGSLVPRLQYKAADVPSHPGRKARVQSQAGDPYFFPVPFRAAVPVSCLAKGEAAGAVFGFSFFGFLASRLPRCSPLAIVSFSLAGSVQHPTIPSAARRFPAPHGNAHKLS